MACRVTLKAAADDGTNIYTEMEVTNNGTTFPLIRPSFATGTAGATIQAYMQVIADNQPTLAADVAALVNTSVVSS